MQTEQKIAKPRDQKDLEKMEDKLNMKNTYMHHFKQEELKKKEEEEMATKTTVSLSRVTSVQFLYDIAKGDVDSNYCKKCKYESKWCKHRKERDDAKEKLGSVLTT